MKKIGESLEKFLAYERIWPHTTVLSVMDR